MTNLRIVWRGRQSGQVTIEYFILFAVVAFATLLAFASFRNGVRAALESGVGAAAEEMATPTQGD